MPKAFAHLIKYSLGLEAAQTQTTQAERDCIVRYAVDKRRAVEIGVFEGVTTGVIASALPAGAELFAVDPFLSGRTGICWGKSIARKQAYHSQPGCHIRFVEDFSHKAAERITGKFDFVFIDGDHSIDGITRDWRDWSHRVDAGAIIALHDTVVPAHNPGVAILGSYLYFRDHIQFDERFEIVEQVDSLSVLRRK